ncbi:hypothetical protein FRC02_002566 [Tulasnella sp. 418]|nr:hypothetical protein FRC02_002566 [Tulasnella sp. 418]
MKDQHDQGIPGPERSAQPPALNQVNTSVSKTQQTQDSSQCPPWERINFPDAQVNLHAEPMLELSPTYRPNDKTFSSSDTTLRSLSTPAEPIPSCRRNRDLDSQPVISSRLLNQSAAALFLFFPLTYGLLTVATLGRIIDVIISDAPTPWVHAVARWALFLQAPLDALVLFIAAQKVKQRMLRSE